MPINRVKNIASWLDDITKDLEGVVERPRREAMLLIMALLHQDELWLMAHMSDEVEAAEKLQNWVARRKKSEPFEYITQSVSFYSQHFFIKEGALIPRPETELLIDEVLKVVDATRPCTLVEVGVGSGVISTVLAQKLPKAKIIAVDISPEALKIAKINIEAKGMQDRIELRLSDLLSNVPEKIDVLVSNPPYIARSEHLDANLDYEPELALFGGHVGDEVIQLLLAQVFLREIPCFACEMGYDQKEKVENYLEHNSYKSLEFYQDWAAFDRGFVLKK